MKQLPFKQKELYIPGLKNTYRILQITDSHIVKMDEREEAFIIKDGPHEGKRLSDFGKIRYNRFCYDGEDTAQRFEQLCQCIMEAPDCADYIVFTGDILDFYTEAAFEFMVECLNKLPIPYLFVLGNHDMIFTDIPDDRMRQIFQAVCGPNTQVQKAKLGELALIGVDNIENLYTPKTLADLKEAMAGEEHVLLFQHIPLSTDDLHRHTLTMYKHDWALGNEGVCEGDSWKEMFELIEAPGSKVRALICGDCHFDFEGPIGNTTQFTSALCAESPAVLYTVHG